MPEQKAWVFGRRCLMRHAARSGNVPYKNIGINIDVGPVPRTGRNRSTVGLFHKHKTKKYAKVIFVCSAAKRHNLAFYELVNPEYPANPACPVKCGAYLI